MPNPVRGLKRTDMRKLTSKQKAIVRKLRSNRLPVKVYARQGKLSVHNPFSDVKRKAHKGETKYVKRYPHASDTEMQRQVRYTKTKIKGARKANPKVKRSIWLP